MSYDTSTLHANVYLDFQQPELLFQFILHELMQAQTLALEVEKLVRQVEETPQRFNQDFLSQLSEDIVNLVSSTPAFPWEAGRGALRKLCDFCRIFTVECKHNDHSSALHRLAQDALCEGVATHTWFVDHTTLGEKLDPITLANLKKRVNALLGRIQEMANLMPTLIEDFQHHENVLYYLLRHKRSLESLFGKIALTGKLTSLYIAQKEETHPFLKERFSARGFDEILPLIDRQYRDLTTQNL